MRLEERVTLGVEHGNEARGEGQNWEWSMGMRLGEEGNTGSGAWE